MLSSALAKILTTFTTNSDAVAELMKFDRLVLDVAIGHVETLHNRLKAHGFDNPRLDVAHTLQLLKGIHEHESLKPSYREMLNQCNVLLVSYFSAAVGDIFRTSVTEAVRSGTRPALMKEDVRIALRDVREIGPDLLDRAGDLFVAHRDISFQDMQSIGRSFRDYFDYEPPKDEVTNDIIMSQACRHVTVHSAGIVDHRMMGQVRSAHPPTLKPEIRENEKVQFTEDEVPIVSAQMKSFLQDLIMNVGGEG
jgi:hypothetical protein